MNMINDITLEQNLSEDPLLTMADFNMDARFVDALNKKLRKKIDSYDPDGFSPDLVRHHEHVASQAESFLVKFYPERIVRNVAAVFGWHDIGKIMDDPKEWRVQKDKPDLSHLTEAQKLERKIKREMHTVNGLKVLDEAVAETMAELKIASLSPDQQKYVDLKKYVISFHHERLDGSGPHKLTAIQQGPILRALAIMDTVNGKEKANSLSQIFHDMSHGKHRGQFDLETLMCYQEHYIQTYAHTAPSGLANPHVS